ncbi:GGDEF domain-containing protein [Plesiomonas sp.]|uniref:GGDEF domain-containing protein n=1 Tax=Plesiomonas sp. TaxID=2486279 RepID=UPI003F39CA28
MNSYRIPVFIVVFMISSTFFYLSQRETNINYMHQLYGEINASYMRIYSAVRQLKVMYANAEFVNAEQAQNAEDHNENDENQKLIILNNDAQIPVLKPTLEKVHNLLNKESDNNIELLSLIQRNGDYGYFFPYKPYYRKIMENTRNDPRGVKIISEYNLPESFDESFTTCDIKASEIYVENFSLKKIQSIFMPIFFKDELAAVVVVDLEPSYIQEKIDKFNELHGSNIYLSKSGFKMNILCNQEKLFLSYSLLSENSLINVLYSLCIAFISTLFFNSYRKIKDSAFTDGLTQLHNRHYFLSQQKNLKQRYSVIIIDIDNFKKINDTHGHYAGDQVLKSVAERIKNSARQDDLLIRWGGEEFVLILYTTNEGAVKMRAESIRQAIADKPIGTHAVTVSLGVCVVCAGNHFDEVFQQADVALYASKTNGKNQVTVGSCKPATENQPVDNNK